LSITQRLGKKTIYGWTLTNIGGVKPGDEKKGEIDLREFSSLEVRVVNNDLERAMRVLKKKIQNDGLFRRLKLKKSYEKPSEYRRRKRRESARRQKIAHLKSSRY